MTSRLRTPLVLAAVLLVPVVIVFVTAQSEKAKQEGLDRAASLDRFSRAANAAAEKQAAFDKLSPIEHLAEAKKLLNIDGPQVSISEGLEHIAAIDKGSPLYKQADQTRRAFEEARRKRDAQEAKRKQLAEAAAKHLLRIELAKTLENKMLDQGLNVDISAIGADQTVLHIKWILVSKAIAHNLSKEADFFSNARLVGFKRIEITDGYDERWWWKLD